MELAGEVLVAVRPGGQGYVQFTKGPFPFLEGQVLSNRWDISFPPENRHYAGRGSPPKALIWLQLPKLLAGEAPPAGWDWDLQGSTWNVRNRHNGEYIEGFFDP